MQTTPHHPFRRLVFPWLLPLLWAGAAAGAPAAATPEGGTTSSPDTAPQSDISAAATSPTTPPTLELFAFHGQATFVEQFHPGFHSAYHGANSFNSGRRGNETIDLTFYAGLRPWRDAEIWIDPEVDQGFGLSNTVGIAGFPSAEAYKIGSPIPYVRIQRLFIRQTFDLGGAAQPIAPDLNQLGGHQSSNRVVATIGKYSVGDVFDTNTYAHDPRNDFLNWSIVDGGAFDYAADAWGYSYGAALEWYNRWYTLRAGLFDGSQTPNSKFEGFPLFQQFQGIVEGEARTTLFGQPGKFKLLGYLTRAKLATFAELEQFFAANPAATNVDAEAARHQRSKFGVSINAEQSITRELGAFVRASLSDGRTEAYEFTDVDASIATGLSLTGARWHRPDDTLGAAVVVDTISKARKDFLAAGGLGVLVGDGKLINAGPEQILETYYSYAIRAGVNLSADYQFVNHPAYNTDRGPVSIFGARVHVQF